MSYPDEPCSLFWPEDDQHGVSYVPLDAELSDEQLALLPLMHELAALGDALRNLQCSDGHYVSPAAADALIERSVAIMRELADAIEGEPAELLRMRATSLAEADRELHLQAASREGGYYELAPLTVLCGPQCTWRLKTPTPLHTVVCAVGLPSYDNLLRALDDSLDVAAAELRGELGLSELQLDPSFPMRVTDMVSCGGEANAFPKHFGYFLPEDQGVPHVEGQPKKTIAFRNAYRERFKVISQPLGDALLKGPRRDPEVPVESALFSWYRGHDIAHSARLPSTDYGWRLDLGHEEFMMMQEALADTYGLLLALTPTWLALADLSPVDVNETFMAELLHYLRRGPWLYGDAGAAYVELSFLVINRFVEIDENGVIEWDSDRLHEGIRELARALAETILAPTDHRACAEFVATYGWPTITPAARTLERLQKDLRAVPTALGYRHGSGSPQPSEPAPAAAAASAS